MAHHALYFKHWYSRQMHLPVGLSQILPAPYTLKVGAKGLCAKRVLNGRQHNQGVLYKFFSPSSETGRSLQPLYFVNYTRYILEVDACWPYKRTDRISNQMSFSNEVAGADFKVPLIEYAMNPSHDWSEYLPGLVSTQWWPVQEMDCISDQLSVSKDVAGARFETPQINYTTNPLTRDQEYWDCSGLDWKTCSTRSTLDVKRRRSWNSIHHQMYTLRLF